MRLITALSEAERSAATLAATLRPKLIVAFWEQAELPI
jgi:hypothetical protein